MVFDLAHFFQIQEPFGLISKIKFGSMYTLYTLPLDDIYCTCA
jgi:hypothetical protein